MITILKKVRVVVTKFSSIRAIIENFEMYCRSIFCLPHRLNFADIFDLCLHWVFVVRATDSALEFQAKGDMAWYYTYWILVYRKNSLQLTQPWIKQGKKEKNNLIILWRGYEGQLFSRHHESIRIKRRSLLYTYNMVWNL